MKQFPNGLACRQRGFTLVELLVVVAMLGVILLSMITIFNPLAQLSKAQDGQRQHDLTQIQQALDSYYNDTGCYPTSLTFGQKWNVNNQVFMEKVPQDPSCADNPNSCYRYEVPSGNCPQWSVLYASLRSNSVPVNACPLVVLNNSSACLPIGFKDNSYNFCLIAGQVDCSVVSSFPIGPTTAPTQNMPTGGGGGGNPTNTPTPLVCQNNNYYGCTGDSRCNSISPKTQCSGYGGSLQCYCDQHCNQQCAFN